MTEAQVRDLLAERHGVSRETCARIGQFVEAVIDENSRQNLISASTVPDIWHRHILDSAQLVWRAPPDGLWIDLGTGAGFPGVIVALLRAGPVLLVESRRKRAEFLAEQLKTLGLHHCEVYAGRAELLETKAPAVISARAFAPLGKTFAIGHRFAAQDTLWLFPKGQSARRELADIRQYWSGVFHVEPSQTDSQAAIIVAEKVTPRERL